MTASIKAGLNNDMHLMTGGVTRQYIDSDGNVGIGTTSPAADIHINTSSSKIMMQRPGVGRTNVGTDNVGGYIESLDNLPVRIYAGGAERFRVDLAGRVTTPYQPAFQAELPTNASITSGWKTFATAGLALTEVKYNIGSHFNSSNNRFTAPVSGVYLFQAAISAVYPATASNYLSVELWVNNARVAYSGWNNKASGYYKEAESFQLALTEGDYVEPGYESHVNFSALGGSSAGSGWYTYFSGTLLG